MTYVDRLRLQLATYLQGQPGLTVTIQGKRLVVSDGARTVLILCTEAKVDDVRERTQVVA